MKQFTIYTIIGIIFTIISYTLYVVLYDLLNVKVWITYPFTVVTFFVIKYFVYKKYGILKSIETEDLIKIKPTRTGILCRGR